MKNIAPCFLSNDGHSALCPPERCAFAEKLRCQRRALEANEHLYYQGDRRTHFYFIRAGLIRLYKILGNGRRSILGFRFPGDFVDLAPHDHYRFAAQAVQPTELRLFPVQEFRRYTAAAPDLAFALLEHVASDLDNALDLVAIVGQRDADARVAAFLMDLYGRLKRKGEEVSELTLPMMKVDIADAIGISQETISRVLTSFEKRGLVELIERRTIRFRDLVTLRALAQGGTARANAL